MPEFIQFLKRKVNVHMHDAVCFEGELDMANPRHVFKAEGNAWIQQLEDQIVLGPSHVFEYIKTDGYKRLVEEE